MRIAMALPLIGGCTEPQVGVLVSEGDFAIQFSSVVDGCMSGQFDRPAVMTVEAWLNLHPATQRQTVSLFGWENEFSVVLVDDTDLVVRAGGPDSVVVPVTLTDKQWHHLAVTWDTFETVVFVDGVRRGSGRLESTVSNSASFSFGCPDNANSAVGLIDDLRLSNYVIYSADFQPQLSLQPEADTVSLWSFSEGFGTVSHDHQQNMVLTLEDLYWLPVE